MSANDDVLVTMSLDNENRCFLEPLPGAAFICSTYWEFFELFGEAIVNPIKEYIASRYIDLFTGDCYLQDI